MKSKGDNVRTENNLNAHSKLRITNNASIRRRYRAGLKPAQTYFNSIMATEMINDK
jgi:hypothetical protein